MDNIRRWVHIGQILFESKRNIVFTEYPLPSAIGIEVARLVSMLRSRIAVGTSI